MWPSISTVFFSDSGKSEGKSEGRSEGRSEGGKSNRNLIVPFCLPPFARSKQRTHWLVQSSQEEEIQLDNGTGSLENSKSDWKSLHQKYKTNSVMFWKDLVKNCDVIHGNKFGKFELSWHLTWLKERPNQSITLVIKRKYSISKLQQIVRTNKHSRLAFGNSPIAEEFYIKPWTIDEDKMCW